MNLWRKIILFCAGGNFVHAIGYAKEGKAGDALLYGIMFMGGLWLSCTEPKESK